MLQTDFLARYYKKIQPEPMSGCWLWSGAWSERGYGVVRKNKRLMFAHRLSYEMTNGKVPKGLELDHKCRVKCCVRPDHLEAVTHRINVLRGDRTKKHTHCKRGHALTKENLYVYVSGEDSFSRACKSCVLAKSGRRYAASKEARNVAD